MFFKLLLTFIITIFLNAEEKITLDWLHTKPKTIAKDFYIYRYLNQDITPHQALDALSQVNQFNNLIFKRFANKYNNKDLKDFVSCMSSSTARLLDKEAYCIEAGLSVYEATKLSSKQLNQTIQKVKNDYPDFAKVLEVIQSENPFYFIEKLTPKDFFALFNNCGSLYRQKNFNHYFNKEFLHSLQHEKDFQTTVKLIVTNLYMNKAQKSLLNITGKELDNHTNLLLAINAIRHKHETKAIAFLENAYNKSYYQFDKDNTTFWLYKITNDEKYLQRLKNSWDLNLYTLFAHQKNLKKIQKTLYINSMI